MRSCRDIPGVTMALWTIVSIAAIVLKIVANSRKETNQSLHGAPSGTPGSDRARTLNLGAMHVYAYRT